MESVVIQTTSSCILCKVVTLNDEEDGSVNSMESAEEDVLFLFRILLEIPPNPGINLVVDGNLINCDHLLLLKSDLVWWCDQCSVAIQQARKLYQQISESTKKFRNIQRNIVKTLQKCIADDESAFNNDENYKAIWRKLCLNNEERFNKFEYPFTVQEFKSVAPRPPPKVVAEKKDEHNQTHLSSYNNDELECKIEDDVKEEEGFEEEEENVPKRQRILLIFPEDHPDKEDQDNDSLLSSPYSAEQDEEEIIETTSNSPGLKAADREEDADPLSQVIKADPDLEPDKSHENIKTKEVSIKTSRKLKSAKRSSRNHNSKNFKCLHPHCSSSYKTLPNLRKHLNKSHPKIPLLPNCPGPPSTFQKKYPELSSKIVRNSKTNLFTCPYSTADPPCPIISKLKATLERHVKSKHLGDGCKYLCTWGQGCTRTFANRNNFQAHMDRHKGTPKFKCDQCDKQFYSENLLISHKQREHEDAIKSNRFVCETCGKSFSCRDYLYKHKSTGCKQMALNENKVTLDKTSSSSSSSPPPKSTLKRKECEICGKVVENLKKHMEYSHTTVRTHMCHLCSKTFKNGPHLRMHIKRHEDTPGVGVQGKILKFQCSVKGCRLRFVRKELLDNHMITRHGENGDKEPALKCQYCGKGFHLTKNLKHHEETHENEGKDPFKCQVCGKGFRTMVYLKYHQKHTHKMKLEDKRKVSKK